MTKEKQHGGSRKGAGRKSKYNEETTTVSFRVPASLVGKITKYVQRLLKVAKK